MSGSRCRCQTCRSGRVTQDCPCCGLRVTMAPYDIGSGPELSCPHCEWCWGADGQPLQPIPAATLRHYEELVAALDAPDAQP